MNWQKIFWTILFLSVPIFGVASFWVCDMYGALWPENVSEIYGRKIDHLFDVIMWITGIFFVGTELLLVYAMLTSKDADSSEKADFVHGNRTMEIGWTLMAAAILVFIAFYQIPTWSQVKIEKPKKPADAHITASMWMWQVRYPLWDDKANGPRKLDVTQPALAESFELMNELHVPAKETVLVYVTSRDVIHSFYIPKMRVKQDAVPGLLVPVWFDAAKPGRYEFYCAELCGPGHYMMRARVVVHESREAYNRWLRDQTQRLRAPGRGLEIASDNAGDTVAHSVAQAR
ncbi:MAG: cytochrome c oxidase subunit II [Gemmatales bacterium]|nr:cytochrome c oxidase subunit II [Gemmatales bacterium]MCS7158914.1 cytochrome c oxidase subunit II [Gemmatales bacterium]MDW8174113.1 cytochrome c oxidase subunit II [Gemmatales bacterium]MDW8221403.1 cytochrome c oxidase subunit II [Gemmatales bacterium]